MKCKNCGTENSENASFCEECGNELVKTENIDQGRNNKNLMLVALILVIVVLGGYILYTTTAKPALTVNNSSNNVSQSSSDSSSSSSSGDSNKIISASEAQSIASQYLASNSKYKNFEAGTPSLSGDVYNVPMVVANSESQSPKGTVVGYIQVDAKTGKVLGVG
ncbi:MAG: zinc-ribbon domain-containing protein [Methanobacterium sp.]|nr:zinc-ribbon domain-containing protein [Methanobacterium sp.]